MKKHNHLFGPVPSRRFKRSLGLHPNEVSKYIGKLE